MASKRSQRSQLANMEKSTTRKRSTKKLKLPTGFSPGEYSVICGQGKSSSFSPGNKNLRLLIHQFLPQYSLAKNKQEKSSVVSAVINHVREASPVGAFVKQDDYTCEWWEVGDSFAREKIGCIFRDLLHKQYRSSTKSKQARKKKKKAEAHDAFDLKTKKTVMSTLMEPLPFFEDKSASSSSFTRVVSPTSLRPYDPSPVEASSTFEHGYWSTDQTVQRIVTPCHGINRHMQDSESIHPRPLRYDIQRDFRIVSPTVSLSAVHTGKNALSLALEDALGLLQSDAQALWGQDEEDFPDDLSNIFDEENDSF